MTHFFQHHQRVSGAGDTKHSVELDMSYEENPRKEIGCRSLFNTQLVLGREGDGDAVGDVIPFLTSTAFPRCTAHLATTEAVVSTSCWTGCHNKSASKDESPGTSLPLLAQCRQKQPIQLQTTRVHTYSYTCAWGISSSHCYLSSVKGWASPEGLKRQTTTRPSALLPAVCWASCMLSSCQEHECMGLWDEEKWLRQKWYILIF